MNNFLSQWLTLLCVGFSLILFGGCKKKASRPARDFSQAESITVTLKKENREDGLRQVEPERAAKTTMARVGGFECRTLKTPEKQEGFIYFIIDPSFKATNAQEVKVVVDYFDATQGSFSLEYDGQAGHYAKASRIVHLKGSAQWETAEFILKNPRFQNEQDNNADFRLRINTPEFFVRRVEVARDTTLTATEEKTPDSVTILLQETPVEEGVRLINERDGKSTPALMEGQACRRIENSYLYFAIEPSFKWAPSMNVKVDVELFDASPGWIEVHYDAWTQKTNSTGAYRSAVPLVQLKERKQWRTETFLLPEGRFEGRENGHSDFRLYVSKPELYVRRVTVSKFEAPATTNNRGRLYTGSNSVSITLGSTNVSDGLEQILTVESKTWPTNIGGQDCLGVQPARAGLGTYIYFKVDPSFKRKEPVDLNLEVEYFAPVRPFFKIQYNSTSRPDGGDKAYRSSSAVSGPTNVWTSATFSLANAYFANLQNEGADFRIQIYTPPFHVRKVTLR